MLTIAITAATLANVNGPMHITATFATSARAEDLADQLAEAGHLVKVKRYGNGNGRHSGQRVDRRLCGVRRIEVCGSHRID